MIKKVLIGVGSVVLIVVGYMGYSVITTKKHSPEANSTYNMNGIEVSVKYCRPYKKGREIFGGLIPFGTYWRTGANEPSIISFSENVNFGGEEVLAGSYRIYTVPNESEWEISLNKELEEWGYWTPDYSQDVLKVKVPVEKVECCVEQFLMDFQDGGEQVYLMMIWDDTFVKVPITM